MYIIQTCTEYNLYRIYFCMSIVLVLSVSLVSSFQLRLALFMLFYFLIDFLVYVTKHSYFTLFILLDAKGVVCKHVNHKYFVNQWYIKT